MAFEHAGCDLLYETKFTKKKILYSLVFPTRVLSSANQDFLEKMCIGLCIQKYLQMWLSRMLFKILNHCFVSIV